MATGIGYTSLVVNDPSKVLGLPPGYYRLRACDTNLTSSSPAAQYQRLKQIQRTVRVESSLYTANIAPLNAYARATAATHGVCWNQQSDRPFAAEQRATIPTGFGTALNRRHTSVTSSKPGSQTPGGRGCDIKHNSYARRLNRLKGGGLLRAQYVPPIFGAPIPFNRAFPIYGGKTVKTAIVTAPSCICPPDAVQGALAGGSWEWPDVSYVFAVGDYVYARQPGHSYWTRAHVLAILGSVYSVQFDNGTEGEYTASELRVWFPCNCGGSIDGAVYPSGFLANNEVIGGDVASCVDGAALNIEPYLVPV